MKKMLFICMVGSLFITSVATANEVVSTNIVGYQEHKGTAKFDMVGCVFVPVTNSTSAILFSKLVSGDFKAKDEVHFLLPSGDFQKLTYEVGTLVDTSDPDWLNWTYDGTGWGDFGVKTDQFIASGQGFWFFPKTNVKVEFPVPASLLQL